MQEKATIRPGDTLIMNPGKIRFHNSTSAIMTYAL